MEPKDDQTVVLTGLVPEPALQELSFIHKGIEIKGIEHLEAQGVLTKDDVIILIDRLPVGFFSSVPLGTIDFLPYRMYSVERDGEVAYVKDDELLPTDTVIARKRAVTRWNREVVDDVAVPTDGKMTINIFSPINWDDKKDTQLDKDTALYSLAHEFGHIIWEAALYAPGIFDDLQARGIPLPANRNATTWLPVLEEWKRLQESMMPRYREYKDIFTKEHASNSVGYAERSLDELAHEEDFAISHEHLLYWRNLANIDQSRADMLNRLHKEMIA